MPRRSLAAAVALGVAATLTPVLIGPGVAPAQTAPPPAGLQNPGFETGTPGQVPASWTAAGPDLSVVTRGDGPSTFRTYTDMGGVTVAPARGQQMLRIGTPKRQAESQPVGLSSTSQTFTAGATTLAMTLRVFSWEHRDSDRDRVSVSLLPAGNATPTPTPTVRSPFTLADNTGVSTCTANPCTLVVDAGSRGDFVNSGWQVVEFSGLVQGRTYTLSFAAGGLSSNSFATWLYVDSVNAPPVARLDLDRPQDCTFAPNGAIYEGQPIPLNDCSYDPDGQIVSRRWQIGFPWGTTATTDRNAFWILASQDGTYPVSLTVTDNEGATATVTVGNTDTVAGDGSPQRALTVVNAPPLVDGVDVQAVEGSGPVRILARYSDAGPGDTHVVTVTTASGAVLPPTVREDDLGAVETGVVTAWLPAPPPVGTTATVTVRVADRQGAAASDVVRVTTVPAVPSQFETPATVEGARPVTVGTRSVDWIDTPTDADLYRVRWPGTAAAQELPAGSELLVTLGDLPADYDVLVLARRQGGATAPGQVAPGQVAPGQVAPGQVAPGQVAPGQVAPGQVAPGQVAPGQVAPGQVAGLYRAPGQVAPGQVAPGQVAPGQVAPLDLYGLLDPANAGALSPFAVNPFQLYPISQRAYTNVGGANLSGTDVSLDELGLGQLATDAGLQVLAYSANRGVQDDVVSVRLDEPQTEVYVLVAGANGEFSRAPYSLQVEGSVSFDQVALAAGRLDLFGGTCQRTALGGNTPAAPISAGGASPTRTLVVTNWERLRDTANVVRPALTNLVNRVSGTVLNVTSARYTAWDARTCDVASANAVSDDVRTQVQAELAASAAAGRPYAYVVLVGSDDVVPYRRVVDETVFANERLYTPSSFLRPGSPLFSSVAGGNNLTMDFYVDAVPSPWQGRALYAPDIPISRLVETPDEIAGLVNAFLAPGGSSLDIGTAFVSGHDFFTDGSNAVASTLSAQTLVNEQWTANDLRCALFGTACPPGSARRSGRVNAVNAHYTHYASTSANGFNTKAYNDVIAASEVPSALASTLYFTIGCHSGLNLPADSVAVDEVIPGVRTSVDWAQSLARQRSILVGSTGFGIGDDAGIAGTERLLLVFAQELKRPGATAGTALQAAKLRYLQDVNPLTVVDEKSVINLSMYGLPMLALTGAAGPAAPTPALAAASEPLASVPAGSATAAPPFTLTANDPAVTATVPVEQVTTPVGSYLASGGDSQATDNRPVLPRVVRPVGATGAGGAAPVHGVIVRHRDATAASGRAGAYRDLDGFDPVVHTPTTEWQEGGGEPTTCLNSWWNAELVRLSTLELGAGSYRQSVVVNPAQFRCSPTATAAAGGSVRGTMRVYDKLDVEVLRSASTDWRAPVIRTVDFEEGTAAGLLQALVALDTTSDLDRIVILRFLGGAVTSEEYPRSALVVNGNQVSLTLGNLADGESFVFQVVDTAGNATTFTAKSTLPSWIEVDASVPAYYFPGQPVTLTATVPRYDLLEEDVWWSWDFGAPVTVDGVAVGDRLSGKVPRPPAGSTVSTFSVTAVYGADAPDPARVAVRVHDSDGGIGVDRAAIRRACDSPDPGIDPNADLIGCDVGITATNATVGITVTGVIASGIQYRVGFDTDGNGGVDKKVTYSNGSISGLNSATFSLTGASTLVVTVPLADVAYPCPAPGAPGQRCVAWQIETQNGTAGAAGVGFVDQMRDALTITVV